MISCLKLMLAVAVMLTSLSSEARRRGGGGSGKSRGNLVAIGCARQNSLETYEQVRARCEKELIFLYASEGCEIKTDSKIVCNSPPDLSRGIACDVSTTNCFTMMGTEQERCMAVDFQAPRVLKPRDGYKVGKLCQAKAKPGLDAESNSPAETGK